MLKQNGFGLKVVASFLLVTSVTMWTTPIYAENLPAGYESVSGSSSYEVSADGIVGTLTAGDAVTIGNWNQGFNIGAGHTFSALLPENGAHLSRDITANPSQIFGALNVPRGKFFLVNSSGIFFSPTAQVNAAGLVASSLDMNNQDFLSGNYKFRQTGSNPGAVVNAGTMNIGKNGGALLGGAVQNTGVIVAKESSLALASGSEATVSFDDSGMLSVLVDKEVTQTVKDSDGQAIKDAVLNKGIVKTEGGSIVMTAEAANDIFDSLVNNEGIVEAKSIGSRSGKILLSSKKSQGTVKTSGTLDATGLNVGEKGGEIVIEGEKVGVMDGAVVDASGDLGGGKVNVGGGFQGNDSNIRNAQVAYVGQNAPIKADAVTAGDGGEVVVWADDTTRYYGNISAQGGAQSGNGGAVEVSGKGSLDFDGHVDTSAANGQRGTLLLDPKNLTVINSGTNFSAPNLIFSANANGNSTVKASGANSISSQNSGVILQATNDITFTDAVSMTFNNRNLTIQAGRSVLINANISTTSGKITITANDSAGVNNRDGGAGNITMGSGVTLNSGGDTITLTIGSTATGLYTPGTVTLGNLTAAGSTITLNAAGAGAFGQQVGTAIVSSVLLLAGTGAFNLSNSTNNVSTLSANTTGAVTYRDTNDFATNAITTNGGGLDLTSGGNLTVQQAVMTGAGSVTLTADGDVDLNSANSDVTTTGLFTVSADANQSANGSFIQNSNSSIAASSASITAAEFQSGAGSTINVGSGSVTLAASTTGATIGVGANRNFDVSDTELDRLTAGSFTVGSSTNTGGITVGDDEAVTAGAKNLTFRSGGTVSFEDNDTTTTGDVSVLGNNLNISGGADLNANNVNLTTNAVGASIGVGAAAGTFQVSDTELDSISAAGLVTVGDFTHTGGVAVDTVSSNSALKFISSNVTLKNAISTATKALEFVGAIALGANTSVTTSGANAKFDGAVTGAGNSLSVNTGAGNADFTGAASSLSSNTVTAANIGLKSVTTTGAQTYTGATSLNGVYQSTTAGSISVNGNATLAGGTTLQTAGAATDDITITGTVNGTAVGAENIQLIAGTGDILLQGAVGAGTQIGNLLVSSANTFTAQSSVNAASTNVTANSIAFKAVTTTGNQTYVGTTNLGGALQATGAGSDIIVDGDAVIADLDGNAGTVDTLNVTTNGGDVTFDGKLDGTVNFKQAINVTAGAGNIAFNDSVGSSVPLFEVNMANTGAQTLPAIVGVANLTISNLTLVADKIISLGSGLLKIGTVVGNAFNLTLIADEINFIAGANSVAGNGAIALRTFTNTLKTVVAGAAELASQLDLTTTDLSALANGFGSITIGGASSEGGIDLNAFTFTDPTVFLSPIAGTINVLGDLTGADNASFTFTGSGNTLHLLADIVTAGMGVTINDNVSVDTNASIDTTNGADPLFLTGANVTVNGTVNGANTLTVQGGTAGTVNFTGHVGSNAALAGLTVGSALVARFGGNVTTTGAQSVTAATIRTNGSHSASTAGAAVTLTGNVELQNTTTLNTNNGGVFVNGNVNGAQTLNVASGTGATTFIGKIGDTSVVTALNVNNANASVVTFTDTVATTGNQSVTAGTIRTSNTHTVTGAGNAITLTGALSLLGATSFNTTNGNVTVTGNVTGAQDLGLAVGTGIVDFVNSVVINKLTVSSANVAHFGNNVTTADDQIVTATAIQTNGTHQAGAGKALTFSGNVTLQNDTNLNASNGAVTVNGTINGAKNLGVSAGTGTVAFNGNVGNGANLSSLTVANAGGTTTFGGNVTTTGNQSVAATTINTNGSHTAVTAGSSIGLTGAINLQNATSLNTTNGNVTVIGTIDGAQDLAVTAGSGNFSVTGAVGTTPLQSLTVNSAGISTFGGNVTSVNDQNVTSGTVRTNGTHQTTGAGETIVLNGNVALQNATTLTTNDGNVTVGGTIDGGQAFSVGAGNGNVALSGNAGGTAALSSVNVSGNAISLKDVKTTAAQTYSGLTTLDGDLASTLGGVIAVNGAATLAGDTTVTTSNNISFSSSIDGAKNLVLNSTAGDVTVNGAIGAVQPLVSLIVSATDVIVKAVTTTGSQSYTGAAQLDGDLTTTGGGSSIALNGTVLLSGDTDLVTNNGDVTVTGAVTGATRNLGVNAASGNVDFQNMIAVNSVTTGGTGIVRFGNSVTTAGNQDIAAGTIQTNSTHQTTGAGSFITLSGNTELEGNTQLTTNDGNVTATGTVNGGKMLGITAGTGTIDVQNAVGGTAAVTSTSFAASNIGLKSVKTTGAQTYTGATSLNGTYQNTVSGAIAVNGASTLAGDTVIQTVGLAGDNILLSGTVDGSKNLSLSSGAGNATVTGAMGGTTDLTSVSATGANVNVKSVKTTGAQSYTGATTLDGAYQTTTAGSFAVSGNTTLAGATTVATAGGAADSIAFTGTVNGSNTLGLNAGASSLTLGNSVGNTAAVTSLTATASNISAKNVKTSGSQTYTAATTLDGTYESTTAGDIAVNGATTLAGNTTTTTAAGNISFNGAVDGSRTLGVTANGGNATFASNVGQGTSLTSLTATGTAVLAKSVKTTGSQSYTGATTLDGSYQLTGAGTFAVNGATTLAGSTNVTTAGGALDSILFGGTVNGANTLALNSGLGSTTLNGSTGSVTPLLSLAIQAGDILVKFVKAVGAQTYTASVKNTVSGDLETTGAGSAIALNGNTVIGDVDGVPATIDTVTFTTNNGNVTFNGKADGTQIEKQSIAVSAGSGNIAFNDSIGSIVKLHTLTLNNTGTQILPAIINVLNFVIQNVNLAANTTYNIGTGSFTAVNVNTNAFDLTVIADEINFTGGVDSVIGTGNLILKQFTTTLKAVVAGAAEVAAQLDLTTIDLGAIKDGFASIVFGSENATGGMDINAFTFKDPVQLRSPLGGSISLLGTLVGIGNASILIDGAGATLTMLANIVTAGTTVTISDSVILGADATIDTTNAGASVAGAGVTITGTVESDTDGARNFVITAGTAGNVTLQGAAGGTNRVRNLTVSGATSTFGGQVRTQFAQTYTGNTVFNGNVQAGGAMNVSNGASSNVNGDVSVQSYTATNVTALNLAGSSDIVTTGGDMNTGVAAVNLNGASGTTNVLTAFGGATGALTLGTVTAASGANLTGSSTGNTSIGSVSLNGGNLNLTVDSNNNSANTLTSGAINAGSVTIAGTGNNDDVTLNGAVTSTVGSVSVQNADDVNINADVTAATSLTINNANLATLAQDADFRSNNGALSVTTVNGITLAGAAGTNRIDSNGGSVTTGNVTATSDANLTVTSQQNITVGNVTLNAGALTVDVDSDGNASQSLAAGNLSASSVELTGTNSNDNATLGTVTSAVGSFLADLFGTIFATGDITSATSATVSNTNSLDLAQDVDVRALTGDVTIGAARLSGATGTNVLDSNGGSVTTGAITTTGDANLTINSENDITVASANINDGAFQANVDDDANGTRTATFGAITADTVTVIGTNGNDLINLNGAVNASGNVQATGGAINVNAPVNTTAGGTVTFTNTGLLTIAAAADMLLDGAFTQNGTGAVSLAGDITTTNDVIDFASAVTLTGNVALASAGANIHFDSTLDGTFGLTLNAGSTGNILFDAAVGAGTQLGALLVQNANDVTLALNENITATSITQLDGSGLTSFTGDVRTTGAAGIHLTGHDFLLGDVADGSDTIVTENGGELCVTCDGPVPGPVGTFTLNTDVSGVTGALCVFGGGVFNLNVDIMNVNGISIDADVVLGGSGTSRTLNAGTNKVTLGTNSSVDAGSFDFNIVADEIDLLGAADTIFSDGNETLTLSPFTQGLDIAIGAANGTSALDLTVAEVATFNDTVLLNDNWDQVNIGAANGSGNVTVNAITFSDATTIRTPQAPGSLYVLGQIFGFDDASITLDGSGSTTHFLANIVTMGGAIHIMDSVIVEALSVLLDATNGGAIAAGGNIQIDGSVEGNLFGLNNLTMNAGSAGNILLGSPVGLGNRLGTFVVTNVNDFTSADLRARSIRQDGGQGISLYQGALNTDGAAGINLTGNAFNFGVSGSVTTTQGGGVTIANAGALNLSSSAHMNLDGAFLQNGAGLVTSGADITTTNDAIEFQSAMTLTDHVSLNSTGGDITLANVDGTTAGAQNLTLISGTGNPLDGDIATGVLGGGTRLGVFTAQNAVDFTNAGLTASQINVSNVSGTAAFNGVMNTSSVNGIEIAANDVTVNGAVTTTNAGDFRVTQDGLLDITAASAMNLDGEFRQTNGTLVSTANLAGNITTSAGNDISFEAPVTLTGASVQNSGRDIRFGNTVNGGQNLTLTAARDIFMDAAAGGVARLGALIVTTVRNWNSNGITAASIAQNAGTGTSTFDGALNTNAAGGVNLTGNVINVNQSVTATNLGGFTASNAGALNIAAAGDMNLDGGFQQLGAGAVNTAGDITTTADDVLFLSAVNLTGPVSIDTNDGGITFNSTVDGGQNLTLEANVANIVMNAAVGAGTRLGALLVNASNDWTVASSISAASIRQNAGAGTTAFNGALNTNGASGINLTSNSFNLANAPVTTTNGGFTMNNSAVASFDAASDVNVSGGNFAQTGSGSTLTAGDIATAGGTLSFASDVILSGDVSMASNGGAMTFADTIDSNGTPRDLTLTAGAGSIAMNDAAGSLAGGRLDALAVNSANNWTAQSMISAGSISQVAGTGTTTFNGALNTDGAAGVDLNGQNFALNASVTTTNGGTMTVTNAGSLNMAEAADIDLDGAFLQDGAGQVNTAAEITTSGDAIRFDGPVNLTGPVAMDSNGGTMTFNGTINGASDLTLDADAGDILMNAAVGQLVRLGNLVVNTVNNWTANAISAASIDQRAGTGATTFSGALNTNAAAGIDLDGSVFNFNQSVTTTNGGTMTVTNAGAMNVAAAGDMNLDGAFLQDGAGAVTTAGDLATSNDAITFNSAMALSGSVSMDSNGGTMTFNGTINGGQNMTLESNAGDIFMNQAVGAGTRLGALLVTSAANWTSNGTTAASIQQNAGTGLTDFNGALNANAAAGINVTTTNVNFDASALASTGDVRANASNDVNVNGGLTASQDIDLQAGNNLTTNASLNAARDVKADANAAMVTNEAITAGRNIEIGQRNNNADLTANDQLVADGAVSIAGDVIALNGVVQADNDASGDEALNVLANDNASSDLNVNAGLFTDGGAINVRANRDANFGATGDVTSNGGAINAQADLDANNTGTLTMNDNTLFDAGSGKIDVRAGQNVTLGGLRTSNTSSDAARVTSGAGDIVDGGDTFTDVDAQNGGVALQAAGSIGATAPFGALEIAATQISAAAGSNVGIFNNSTAPLTVALLTVAGDLALTTLGHLLVGLITARSFNITASGDIIDTNGDNPNLVGGTTSSLTAGNVIGRTFDALDVQLGDGDLIARAGGILNGMSMSIRGTIQGSLVPNLTSGLVIFNAIGSAGQTLPFLTTGFQSGLNVTAIGMPRLGYNDAGTLSGLAQGYALKPGGEKITEPSLLLAPSMRTQPSVLVNVEQLKKWTRRAFRPTVAPAPVLIPVPAPRPAVVVVPAPVQAPFLDRIAAPAAPKAPELSAVVQIPQTPQLPQAPAPRLDTQAVRPQTPGPLSLPGTRLFQREIEETPRQNANTLDKAKVWFKEKFGKKSE